MSARFVILIDADHQLNAHLRDDLARYGFRVEAVTDPNEVIARQEDLPQLVVLCIDPKRTGWAVCNRLRKAPGLKGVPLVVTSAEATEKDFEDHKKLKTRADDYLHKPFAADALVQKISELIGLPEPPAVGADDIQIESEEIQVEDEGLMLEEDPTTGPGAAPLVNPEDYPSLGEASGFDDDIDSTRVGVTLEGLEAELAALDAPAGVGEGDSPFESAEFTAQEVG
jgi:CheY-like chemotaxis protein